MLQIHYFNPGHETAVLLGKRNYTAPTNVRKMQKDLAILPIWYAKEGDFVFVDENLSSAFLKDLPEEIRPTCTIVTKDSFLKDATSIPLLEASPWGLSPQSLYVFEQLQKKVEPHLSVREWKEEYFRLTGRQTAAFCLEKIGTLLTDLAIPAAPRFCTTIQEIETYMALTNPPFVLKTPYSSSGRGLSWVKERSLDKQTQNWILGAINKQGTISIEKGLEKVQDFAMEFSSDGNGNVCYEGLSVFNTEERGAYTGNILEEQSIMLQRITKFVDIEVFDRIQETVRTVLEKVYGNIYKGCIGVDMIVYKTTNGYAIHPCIEINMRYTMGMVALRLFQHLITTNASGYYQVCFEKNPNEAFQKHQEMTKRFPLVLQNGKIKSGYLPLCPVDKNTNYRAFLVVE